MQLLLWEIDGESLKSMRIDRPHVLTKATVDLLDEPQRLSVTAGGDAVVVAPTAARNQAIAVAIVPEQFPGLVTCGGIPVGAGVHPLRHGEQLTIDGVFRWLSSEAAVQYAHYDPASHGQDVYCFITKARLSAGQLIAICPGSADKTCGVIYKREAWEMAQQGASPMKCPNCGFDPKAAPWSPPQPQTSGTLQQLLTMIGAGA